MLCFSGSLAWAQKENVDVMMVSSSGDTSYVKIKSIAEERISGGVTVVDEKGGTTKVNAKSVQYLKIINTNEEYFARPYDKKMVFMRIVLKGEIGLFEYQYREKKGSNYKVENEYFVEKPSEEKFSPFTKKNYRDVVNEWMIDNEALVKKVNDKYYTYDDKEAIVEEYNNWLKNGKPGKTWTREEGNFTLPQTTYNYVETPKEPRAVYDPDMYGSRFGLEIPLFGTYSIINYPDQLNNLVRSKSGGFGYHLGIGARVNAGKSFSFRAGLNFKMKRYISEFVVFNTTDSLQYLATEHGNFYLMGTYFGFSYDTRTFFIGAMLDIAYYNHAKFRYDLQTMNGVKLPSFDDKESIIAEKLRTQADLSIVFGYKFSLLNKQLNLKPSFIYSFPLSRLFHVQGTNGLGLNAYLVQLGLFVDIGFKKK